MKKSTYIWIGIFSLWFMVISSPLSNSPNDSGIAYLLGEFIGTFLMMYAFVWIGSKVQGMFKKAKKA